MEECVSSAHNLTLLHNPGFYVLFSLASFIIYFIKFILNEYFTTKRLSWHNKIHYNKILFNPTLPYPTLLSLVCTSFTGGFSMSLPGLCLVTLVNYNLLSKTSISMPNTFEKQRHRNIFTILASSIV